MITVPASEFSKNFGRYRDLVQREIVAVTNHERITGYFVSTVEYEEFVKLKAMATRSLPVEELSEETIRAIANAKMDSRHDYLNALLDD